MPIDLQPFCATEADEREHLWKPWKDGDWVYATNGHIALRVPAAHRPDITDRPEKAPDAAALFAKAFGRDGNFLLMPPTPPRTMCRMCDGAGKVRAIKCRDCKEGLFQHGDHTYECQNCGGAAGVGWQELFDEEHAQRPDEVRRPCEHCYGRGYSLQVAPMNIGDVLYSPAYLSLFAELPQARIRAGDPVSVAKPVPAAILFDGGQGIVMPRCE